MARPTPSLQPGDKVHSRTIIEIVGRRREGGVLYRAKCACGRERVTSAGNLNMYTMCNHCAIKTRNRRGRTIETIDGREFSIKEMAALLKWPYAKVWYKLATKPDLVIAMVRGAIRKRVFA